MASYNRVVLIGNITRDFDVRFTANGKAVTDIGLAVNDRFDKDKCTFVDVTLWGRQAEVAHEYLGKGRAVLIEGRLELDQWEQEGQRRSKLKVVCENMVMLPSGGGGGSGGQRQSSGSSSPPPASDPPPPANPPIPDDEVPF